MTPEQAEKLVLASTEGKLQLTLRNDSDNAQLSTTGVQLKELVKHNGSAHRSAARKTQVQPKNTKTVEVIHSGEREAVIFEDGERTE